MIYGHSPHKSLRKLSQQTGLSYGTCQKAVKRKLHLHSYKISLMQKLLPPDFEKRLQYCHWFNENVNDELLNLTFFSDEAWFYLTEAPGEFFQTPLHPVKIGVGLPCREEE